MKVHIFIGKFQNRASAVRYTEPYWEPEPDEEVSDKEYEEWENRNPTFKMSEDLNCYLDSDFIETITGNNKVEYCKSMLKEPNTIVEFENELKSENAVLVLIFEKAINQEKYKFENTSKLKYIGSYQSTLE